MRNSIFGCCMLLALAGCGQPMVGVLDMISAPDLIGTPDLIPDLLTSAADLMTAPDLRAPAITACGGPGGYVQCLNDCDMNSTTQAEYNTCAAVCDTRATAAVESRYNAALGCGQNYCLGTNDMGPTDCIVVGMQIRERDGTGLSNTNPLRDCLNCLNNSLAGLFGGACPQPSDPDCNPAQCTAVTTACTGDVIGAPDMMSAPDMIGSAAPDMVGSSAPDLRAPAITMCGGPDGYVACLLACATSANTQAEYDACLAVCDTRATAAVEMRYFAAIACGQNYCVGTNDMGPKDCIVVGPELRERDGSPISNMNPLQDCLNCLNNSFASLFGDACVPANDPDCNPAQCTAVTAACTGDQ